MVKGGAFIMPENFKREDLRIIKTRKALTGALHSLLRRYSFSRITVHHICAEAMVSRSAFYAHFRDKYALLEYWLTDLRNDITGRLRELPLQQLAENLCETFLCNTKVCTNLLGEADRELFALLVEYLPPDIRRAEREETDSKTAASHRALSDFLAGGLFSLLIRFARSGQVSEECLRATVQYTYNMIQAILDWDAAQHTAD
jgi:AcrR family transcriptional regulator